MDTSMKISIIGSGWVGKNTGKGLERLGHEIIFHDVSKEKVENLLEIGYEATTDIEEAVLDSDVTYLCVPTPTGNGEINLNYLEKATKDLARVLEKRTTTTWWLLRAQLFRLLRRNWLFPF